MANFTITASKQRPDGLVQILLRVDITRTNRPRFKTGIWVYPHHIVDGAIKAPRSGRLNQAEVQMAKDSATLLASYVARIENIIAVSKSHLESIDKEWLEKVIELDKAGRIEKVVGENPFVWSNIEKAFNSSEVAEQHDVQGLSDIYQQIKTYCAEKRISDSRKVGYYAMARTIYRYSRFVNKTDKKRKGFVFDVCTLTKNDILDFIDYTRNEGDLAAEYTKLFEQIKTEANSIVEEAKVNRANLSAKNRSANTIVILFSMLRTIIKWLREEKQITDNDPLVGVKVEHEHYVEHPVYLTLEERNLFADFDFSGRPALDFARDVFILQCLTGCRYNDLASLTEANINNGVLSYIPAKTIHQKEVVKPRVPLTSRALAIIAKYKGVDKDGRLLPFNIINGFNVTLKKAFEVAGLNRNVQILNRSTGKNESVPLYQIASSHLARRTFCGNLYKKIKDPNLIGKMSGHVSGSHAFARYRDIDDEDLQEAICLID